MHIMIYKKAGDAYVNLPVWFNEGLASAVELYPDPNYPLLMQTAYQKDGLIPMTGLCQSFPKNASSALMAYAEASSFVNYLYRRFGNTGMEALLKMYADGLACERGFEAALGSPLAKVEQGWLRETFETSPALSGLENLMPWVVVLAVIVVMPLAIGVRGIALKRKEEAEI